MEKQPRQPSDDREYFWDFPIGISKRGARAGTGTVTSPSIQQSFPRPIEMLRGRFGDPSVKASLEGFTKTLRVSLTDTNSDYVFTIRDGELSSLEKTSLPLADITITVESSLMEGILTGKSNAIISYVTGRLKVKGGMDDLLRLQKLLG